MQSSPTPQPTGRPLRVAVGCRLMYYRRAGIAQYARQLVTALAASGAGQLTVITDRRDRDTNWIPLAHNRFEQVLPPEVAPDKASIIYEAAANRVAAGSIEKRWVDGVLARKKGLGL